MDNESRRKAVESSVAGGQSCIQGLEVSKHGGMRPTAKGNLVSLSPDLSERLQRGWEHDSRRADQATGSGLGSSKVRCKEVSWDKQTI
jgi:hypothetical protein